MSELKEKRATKTKKRKARQRPWGLVPADLSPQLFVDNGFPERHAIVLQQLYLRAPSFPDEIQRRTDVSRHTSRIRAILEYLEGKRLVELTIDGWRPSKSLGALVSEHRTECDES